MKIYFYQNCSVIFYPSQIYQNFKKNNLQTFMEKFNMSKKKKKLVEIDTDTFMKKQACILSQSRSIY